MAGASVKINFQAAGKDGLSLQEFLEAFPDIVLTKKQVDKIEDFLMAFCLSILQEMDYIDDKEMCLTIYLKSLITISDNGDWYVTPLNGMKMFFHGLRVICIYNVTYSPNV